MAEQPALQLVAHALAPCNQLVRPACEQALFGRPLFLFLSHLLPPPTEFRFLILTFANPLGLVALTRLSLGIAPKLARGHLLTENLNARLQDFAPLLMLLPTGFNLLNCLFLFVAD